MSIIGNAIMLGGGSTPPPTPPALVPEKDVIYIDYDGTILYSYDADEFLALTAHPANPTHDGLTSKGWNWTFSDAKTYVQNNRECIIGQLYEPTDGWGRLYFEILSEDDLIVTLPVTTSKANDTVIDWGDGSETYTVPYQGNRVATHTYSSVGKKCIKAKPTTGTVMFGNSSYAAWAGFASYAFANSIYAVELTETCGICYCSNKSRQKTFSMPGSSIFQNNNFSTQSSDYLSSMVVGNIVSASRGLGQCHGVRYISVQKNITLASGNAVFAQDFSLRRALWPNSTYPASLFQDCRSIERVTVNSTVTSIGASTFNGCVSLNAIYFRPSSPPSVDNSNAFTNVPTTCAICVPFASLASYLQPPTNYPSKSTYTYLGMAVYQSGAALPTQDSTSAYNVTWYASIDDAKAQTNAISTGNGKEIYCRYTAV